ncbi:MinD/ParA family ATP-binding protein [Halospeciosus flavus]|uniref:MinD/ParA family ATP-binding protein n=1 Tax=Halospeciosus flavus TaxID=3032283 RepID=UPI00361CAE88
MLPAGGTGDAIPTSLFDRLPGDRPVLVDCPAGASRAAADPLRHADAVLLVTTADPQTVEDALKTAAMARTLGTRVLGVVCNRVDTVPPSLAAAFDAPCLVSLLAFARCRPRPAAGRSTDSRP